MQASPESPSSFWRPSLPAAASSFRPRHSRRLPRRSGALPLAALLLEAFPVLGFPAEAFSMPGLPAAGISVAALQLAMSPEACAAVREALASAAGTHSIAAAIAQLGQAPIPGPTTAVAADMAYYGAAAAGAAAGYAYGRSAAGAADVRLAISARSQAHFPALFRARRLRGRVGAGAPSRRDAATLRGLLAA